jgi:D-alanine-D-alanine ligase-like ATP-grasp enzyme
MTNELLRRGFTRADGTYPRKFTRFTAPSGESWITTIGLLKYPFISHVAQVISKQKHVAQDFAAHCGLRVPVTIVLPEQSTQIDTFLAAHDRVVVKPHSSYGSHGVTLDITNRDELDTAIELAQNYSDTILVQEQFAGEEVRLTVLDGEVVSCILRQTPRVIGDGSLSIAELIAQENKLRMQYADGMVPYPQLDNTMIDARFFSDDRVPNSGEVVKLSRSTLVATGAAYVNITSQVHESYKQKAVALAEELGAKFLAVDFLIDGYDEPAADNYIFLECNTAPSLRLYYGRRGEPDFDIVPRLADMIETSIKNNQVMGTSS